MRFNDSKQEKYKAQCERLYPLGYSPDTCAEYIKIVENRVENIKLELKQYQYRDIRLKPLKSELTERYRELQVLRERLAELRLAKVLDLDETSMENGELANA